MIPDKMKLSTTLVTLMQYLYSSLHMYLMNANNFLDIRDCFF